MPLFSRIVSYHVAFLLDLINNGGAEVILYALRVQFLDGSRSIQ